MELLYFANDCFRMHQRTENAHKDDEIAYLQDFHGYVATTWNHNNIHWSLIVVDPQGIIHWLDSLNEKYVPEKMDVISRYVIQNIIYNSPEC